jgi:hypothetical protein
MKGCPWPRLKSAGPKTWNVPDVFRAPAGARRPKPSDASVATSAGTSINRTRPLAAFDTLELIALQPAHALDMVTLLPGQNVG